MKEGTESHVLKEAKDTTWDFPSEEEKAEEMPGGVRRGRNGTCWTPRVQRSSDNEHETDFSTG